MKVWVVEYIKDHPYERFTGCCECGHQTLEELQEELSIREKIVTVPQLDSIWLKEESAVKRIGEIKYSYWKVTGREYEVVE